MNAFARSVTTLAATAVAMLGGAAAGWSADFSQWTDSTRVLLNTTPAGADVAADLNDFPVLVRMTAADFVFSEAKADGSDLRFADSAGTPLPFELERFDPVNKLAEAWVLPAKVKGDNSAQGFRMYWGNSGATSLSSGPAVFPSSGNFAGIWHLGEDGGNAAGGYKDASSYANHGTGLNMTAASDVAGAIGTAANFLSASSQGVSAPHNASLHPTGNLTLEAWIKSTSQGSYKRFINKPFSAIAPPWNEYSLESDVTGSKAVFSLTLAGGQNSVVGTTDMANGTWYHVVGTYDGTFEKVYVNGALEGTLTISGAVSDYGQAVSIGKYGLDNNSNFDGAVDEARISLVARGADWIKLCYANQRPDQKMVTYQRFAQCQSQFTTPKDTTVDEGSVVSLKAKVECAASYSWSAVSGPAPQMLDPEVKVLNVNMPRVAGDTAIVYRFSADIGGSMHTGDVRVSIKEAIPDPVFTLPAGFSWNAWAPWPVRPVISNAAAIQASREPTLRYAWTLGGVTVDSVSGADNLVLSNPAQSGTLTVGLCLDNRGTPACKQTTISVSVPVGLLPHGTGIALGKGKGPRWDAKGRARRSPSVRRNR